MKQKRNWQPRELRLVSEYLASQYPNALVRQRVRLGGVPPSLDGPDLDEHQRRAYTVFNRWADAVVILPRQLIIVEGSIPAQPNKIAQLEIYGNLILSTPEFAEFTDHEIKLVMLSAVYDPVVEKYAKSRGVKFIVFSPPWVKKYLQERARRYSASTIQPIK